ncbi:MAG: hypothetical protein LUC16_01720 [Coprobacillus sp.]|nr:hypothetical protein [Coprobacillus sp.]
MKTLIAYYSLSGNTKKVAKKLESLLDADIVEIKGKKNYGSYMKAVEIAGKEFETNELPECTTKIDNLSEYDRLLVGFPLWYNKAPNLVVSFLTSLDLNGIEIYPFCTSGSQSIDGAMIQLSEYHLDAIVHPGYRFSGALSEEEVRGWLN